jgi:hypothetical protein
LSSRATNARCWASSRILVLLPIIVKGHEDLARAGSVLKRSPAATVATPPRWCGADSMRCVREPQSFKNSIDGTLRSLVGRCSTNSAFNESGNLKGSASVFQTSQKSAIFKEFWGGHLGNPSVKAGWHRGNNFIRDRYSNCRRRPSRLVRDRFCCRSSSILGNAASPCCTRSVCDMHSATVAMEQHVLAGKGRVLCEFFTHRRMVRSHWLRRDSLRFLVA